MSSFQTFFLLHKTKTEKGPILGTQQARRRYTARTSTTQQKCKTIKPEAATKRPKKPRKLAESLKNETRGQNNFDCFWSKKIRQRKGKIVFAKKRLRRRDLKKKVKKVKL